MTDNNNYCLKLFACCLPVKGTYRSLICDLQRDNFHFIPNILYEILTNLNQLKILEIKRNYSNKHDDLIDQYFNFLIHNEFAFFCKEDDLNSFPSLSLQWKSPSKITNIILDFTDLSYKHNYLALKVINQLTLLGCHYVEIRIYNSFVIEDLEHLLSLFDESNIRGMYLLAQYNEYCTTEFLNTLTVKFPRINQIIFNSSPLEKSVTILDKEIYFTKTSKKFSFQCGIVQTHFFSNNISLFTESQHHNSCLNRKISIDVEGNIKNCPSMPQSFGNIRDTTLEEAINHPDFKKYWDINKDKIHVCKDCEFRYICTDCRAYVEDPADIYSKPLKCGYNPYTGEWSEWSTNPLKQKAIEYYGMQELVKSSSEEK